MAWRPRHHREPMPRASLYGSLAVHGGVVVATVLLSLTRPAPIEFQSIEIQIVQAPSPEPLSEEVVTPTKELVVERPDPEPPLPEPDPVVEETPPPVVEEVVETVADEPEEEEPEPEEEDEEEAPPPDPDPEPVEEVAATPEPDDDPTDLAGEELEVRIEGLQRDYPRYYENIVRQLRRCFRPPGSARRGSQTTVYFEIRRDGTTTGERLYERSGNPDLDFGSIAAVADCAGRNALFGPLPEDYPYEGLPVLFEFRVGNGPDRATR